MRWILHLPQGSSLEVGLCCPGPSTLNRPHPPRSRAHRDFTARRLIRDVFAVRERLGDPRVVPGFRCPFLPDMPSSTTPGSSTSICSRVSTPIWPSPNSHRLGTPDNPANPFHAGVKFRGFTGSLPLRPARLLAPLYGSDWDAQPSGAFTSRLSTDRSPSPLLDMTTTSTGLLMSAGLAPAGMAASLAARELFHAGSSASHRRIERTSHSICCA
jgi:hypothetical protein